MKIKLLKKFRKRAVKEYIVVMSHRKCYKVCHYYKYLPSKYFTIAAYESLSPAIKYCKELRRDFIIQQLLDYKDSHYKVIY